MPTKFDCDDVRRVVRNLITTMGAPEAAERVTPLIEAMLEVHRQKSLVSGGDGTVSIRSIHVSRFDENDRSQPTLTATVGDQSTRYISVDFGIDGACFWMGDGSPPHFYVCLLNW